MINVADKFDYLISGRICEVFKATGQSFFAAQGTVARQGFFFSQNCEPNPLISIHELNNICSSDHHDTIIFRNNWLPIK